MMSAPRLGGTRNDITLKNPHRTLIMPIFGFAPSRSPSTALYLWFAASISLALLLPSRSWCPRTTSPVPSNSYSSSEYCFLGPALIPHPVSETSAEYIRRNILKLSWILDVIFSIEIGSTIYSWLDCTYPL